MYLSIFALYCLLQCTPGSCGRLVFLVNLGSGYPVLLWRCLSWYEGCSCCFILDGFDCFPCVNIALTASMVANCELQILTGMSLSAAVKNYIACVILYFAVMWGCVRYLCKYSAVSVIINALIFPSIA